MRNRLALTLGLLAALAGCQPTFKPESTLTVDGAPFRPSTCHTLASGGIELLELGGARLVLALPPERLDDGQELKGIPQVRLEPGVGKAAVELGACGNLTLRGEGYHGDGRRAASGQASLACTRGAALQGELRFTGCF